LPALLSVCFHRALTCKTVKHRDLSLRIIMLSRSMAITELCPEAVFEGKRIQKECIALATISK